MLLELQYLLKYIKYHRSEFIAAALIVFYCSVSMQIDRYTCEYSSNDIV